MGIDVVPANEAGWDDVLAVFGERGEPGRCSCEWFKLRNAEWRSGTLDEPTAGLRQQTGCDDRGATSTSGVIAYLDGEPAGWCAVEPRTAYPRLRVARLPWAGRDEDKDDA